MSEKKFKYSYDSLKSREIGRIASKYTDIQSDLSDTGLYRIILKMDKKAEKPAVVFFYTVLVIGILTFGGALSMALVSGLYVPSVFAGIVGVILIIAAFRGRDRILTHQRRKYRTIIEKILSGDF
ncbi:MAG: hypothetical protein K5634_02085 [Sphaerochaetaceae bacterium]|nr:hypothetical protein [Sphaerochaetaceae bacterium]